MGFDWLYKYWVSKHKQTQQQSSATAFGSLLSSSQFPTLFGKVFELFKTKTKWGKRMGHPVPCCPLPFYKKSPFCKLKGGLCMCEHVCARAGDII
jgi:hypothetical protein